MKGERTANGTSPGSGQGQGTGESAGATRTAVVIEARGVGTRFGRRIVHEGLDLDVHRGEILGIVGASGSGKSVLLRALLGLLRPSAGTIRLLGAELHALDRDAAEALRRRTGVMFQRGALFSSLDALGNVAFALRRDTELSAEAVDVLARLKLALAGLPPDAAGLLPGSLSGGMVKRVALARALALDPELLFMDEPTAGLDPHSAAELDDLIVALARDLGLTVVLVSHDLDSLWRTTDRVAFLAERQVVATAPIETLSHGHVHPLVTQYFSGARAHAAEERAWNRK